MFCDFSAAGGGGGSVSPAPLWIRAWILPTFLPFVFRTCKNEGKCVMTSATSYTCKCYEGYGSVDCEKPSGKAPIGTASASSVEFLGLRPRMYIEDIL